MKSWFACGLLGLALAGRPRPGAAQTAPAAGPVAAAGVAALPAAFYATYTYRSYTVVNPDSGEPPARIPGAGGTLALRPDGTYVKQLRLKIGDGPPREFNQQGQFSTVGDSIFFRFADKNGADTQRGSFRYQPAARHLTITLAGYPPGNAGIYELSAAPPAPSDADHRERPRPGSKSARAPRPPAVRPR